MKLITAALTLVALALGVISTVSIAVFHGYLLRQADQQLRDYAERLGHRGGGAFGDVRVRAPGGFIVELLGPRGRPLAISGPGGMQLIPEPEPQTGNPVIPASTGWISAHTGEAVTVPASDEGGSWRVMIKAVHFSVQRVQFVPGLADLEFTLTDTSIPGNPATLVVGEDLGTISQTIRKLTVIDLAVSGVVIVILTGIGIALIRASLRPLAEIEQTAGAIAAGDLSRRVPDRDPRTEVGSLARSLNSMLGQIEQAFRARSSSEETARRSEDRMRRFVADASHELRTPLSVIRGFAEYHRQRGGLKAAELDRMIRRIEDEAARMGVLVEDLLLLARLDQQRPLQHKPIDLLALAADGMQDARVLAPQRDIHLNVGSRGPFIVLGDEARLRQIIRNLLSNALTHTPDGAPVEIRLGAGMLAGAGGPNGAGHGGTPAAVLEVADSGPGLSAHQAERVFERFYRADAARTRKTGGTGLGLAIVAALAAAHGGTASVDTAPGSGATFRITLPLAPDAARVQAATGSVGDRAPAGPTPGDAASSSPAPANPAASGPAHAFPSPSGSAPTGAAADRAAADGTAQPTPSDAASRSATPHGTEPGTALGPASAPPPGTAGGPGGDTVRIGR